MLGYTFIGCNEHINSAQSKPTRKHRAENNNKKEQSLSPKVVFAVFDGIQDQYIGWSKTPVFVL